MIFTKVLTLLLCWFLMSTLASAATQKCVACTHGKGCRRGSQVTLTKQPRVKTKVEWTDKDSQHSCIALESPTTTVVEGTLTNHVKGDVHVIYEVSVEQMPHWIYLFGSESCEFSIAGQFVSSVSAWVP